MMGFLTMLGRAFAPGSPGPQNESFSLEVREFLLKLADRIGDAEIIDWVKTNPAFVYDASCAWGYTWPPENGKPPRIGLHKDLLKRLHSPRAEFTGGHELGHIRQYLRGEIEPPKCSLKLYRLELDASAFGYKAVRVKRLRFIPSLYRFKTYHHVVAAESTYPGWAQLVGGIIIFFGAYKLYRFWVWCSSRFRWVGWFYEELSRPIDKIRFLLDGG